MSQIDQELEGHGEQIGMLEQKVTGTLGAVTGDVRSDLAQLDDNVKPDQD